MNDEDSRYFRQFLKEYQGESDRGAALVGAAQVDKQLADLLRSFLLPIRQTNELLEGNNAPLGTFSARITAAYCLGLITDLEHNELHLIRKVRNEFAHHTHGLTFESEKVASLCANFSDRFPPGPDHPVSTPRHMFINGVMFVSLGLWNRPHSASEIKVEKREWKY